MFSPMKVIDEMKSPTFCIHVERLTKLSIIDDPLAVSGDLLAHPLNKEVKSSQIFDKIATWIYDCDMKHQLCRHLRQSGDHPFNQNEPPPLPSRVLDLCLSDGSEDIRLIESSGSCGLYAALSHCWGTAPLITTLRGTVTARLDRIEFLHLSRTFQDAATIAREMKLRYLWIDSLCIIQDDSSDWERESARMGDIYRNAFITIAAAGARDGSEGCFIPRLEPILEPVCFQQTSSKGEEGSMWIGLYPGDFISSVTSGPLNARGWVLQERVLASRTVHFAKEQVFWECDQLTISEDGRAMFHYDSLRHILSPLPSLHLQYLARNQSPSQFLYDQWYSLVENYTSRKLTKLDDIFPALSGVVSEVTKLISDEYIAGLWKSCLHVGLLWQSKGVNWGGLPRPTVKRAPSWSWAAVDGPISYLSSSRIRHTKVNFSAITIHDAYCAIFGQNPYGQINKSFIKLTGLLKEAILDDGDQPEIPGFEIQFPKGHLVGTGYLDAEAGPKENIFVLKISKSSEKSEPGLFWFVLLLKQVEEGSDCYERVGMGKLTEFNWFDDSLDKTITLI